MKGAIINLISVILLNSIFLFFAYNSSAFDARGSIVPVPKLEPGNTCFSASPNIKFEITAPNECICNFTIKAEPDEDYEFIAENIDCRLDKIIKVKISIKRVDNYMLDTKTYLITSNNYERLSIELFECNLRSTELYNRGRRIFSTTKYISAIPFYKSAINYNPLNYMSYFDLSQIYRFLSREEDQLLTYETFFQNFRNMNVPEPFIFNLYKDYADLLFKLNHYLDSSYKYRIAYGFTDDSRLRTLCIQGSLDAFFKHCQYTTENVFVDQLIINPDLFIEWKYLYGWFYTVNPENSPEYCESKECIKDQLQRILKRIGRK